MLTSTDPIAGAGAWKAAVLHDVADDVSCLRVLCLLATDGGDILTS